MAHAYEIIRLLKRDDVRKKLVETITEAHGMAAAWLLRPPEDFPDCPPPGDWQEAYEFWVCNMKGWHEVQQILREHVFRRLAKPHPVTLEEVASLFIFDICGIDTCDLEYEPDFDGMYPAFLSVLENRALSYRCSDPFPVSWIPKDSIHPERLKGMMDSLAAMKRDRGKEKPDEAEAAETPNEREDSERDGGETGQPAREGETKDMEEQEDERPFWQRDGIQLVLVGRGYLESNAECLYARIQGCMSGAVLHDMTREIAHLFPSVVRSVAILEPEAGDDGSDRMTQQIARRPTASESLLRRRGDFIRTCLDSYYATTGTQKDSFDRRIPNALNLLAESDAQTNEAVGLALSVAAIEALLGEKGQNLTERLADNVAVLLEPDPKWRNDAAEFVKRIYDVRSRVLHGEQVEGEATVRAEARRLAAAVLIAVISRRDFMSRIGFGPEKPADLLRELRKGRFQAGETPGVDKAALSVQELWRGTA
ncbi:MAG TPA: hypothetical protein VNA25_30780 [Phycisphaerae bacterium]|nr:hypothetical protein [Phycisphaerae bacterium]